ncbi:hypothetical protein [Acidovorax sp. Root70]|uniref:hypothetical protein n=1 Tax=Acidovorax sp. Root70 TaxID=1736590 RepID=UPI0006F2191C|nr:hypothetical protein [Acidovorax sp. Root70]KRB30385.1 hypothetical protein ASD94_04150 [Acidovorax sp. Root70]
MSLPIDPTRSALPPVAQFLAEAALQRQTALLGLDKPKPAAPAPLPIADPSAPPPSVTSPSPPGGPLPAPADQASISPQAREQLAAGFDPRRPGGADGGVPGTRGDGAAQAGLSPAQPRGATAAAPGNAAAPAASATGAATWPASGLGTPLLRMVSALVAQVTAEAGVPQRVVAAQPWPIGMAQALESGALDADQPPLQTWLVRQGVVATPEGPRGLALTLRAPVPWLAAQASPAAAGAVQVGASLGAGANAAGGALQVPFAGGGQALQSGVMALVLQGMDAAAPRTSALLVLDLQPQLAATVYGRDMLQQATGRLDPWTQMAVLQASGQVPREDERARNGASGLCDTAGCPYAARAACVQPFCMAMRGVLPPEPVGPVPLAGNP